MAIEGYKYQNGTHLADTGFLNRNQHKLEGFAVVHLGFGDFRMQGPNGAHIDFVRGGPNFEGQSGRSHYVSDNRNGALIAALLEAIQYADR